MSLDNFNSKEKYHAINQCETDRRCIYPARQIIEKLTEAIIEVEGENLRSNTLVIIEDIKQGDWAVGGKTMTAKDVHQLQRGKAVA